MYCRSFSLLIHSRSIQPFRSASFPSRRFHSHPPASQSAPNHSRHVDSRSVQSSRVQLPAITIQFVSLASLLLISKLPAIPRPNRSVPFRSTRLHVLPIPSYRVPSRPIQPFRSRSAPFRTASRHSDRVPWLPLPSGPILTIPIASDAALPIRTLRISSIPLTAVPILLRSDRHGSMYCPSLPNRYSRIRCCRTVPHQYDHIRFIRLRYCRSLPTPVRSTPLHVLPIQSLQQHSPRFPSYPLACRSLLLLTACFHSTPILPVLRPSYRHHSGCPVTPVHAFPIPSPSAAAITVPNIRFHFAPLLPLRSTPFRLRP